MFPDCGTDAQCWVLEIPMESIGSIGRCRSSNVLCALEASNQSFWKLDIVIGSFQWKLPIPKLVISLILSIYG